MNYEAQGGLKITNCGEYEYITNVITLFQKGDLVYVKYKARRGKLEKVVIKKINLINQYDWNYQDTQNRIWLEYELCDLNEANSIIKNYINQRNKKYAYFIERC